MNAESIANPEIVAVLITLQTSLTHLEQASREIKEAQCGLATELKTTRDALAATREEIATLKGGLSERRKVGDWLVNAIIAALTSMGVMGIAKALKHTPL